MKKIAQLTFAIVLTLSLGTLAHADDKTITVKKAGEHTAKVQSADGKGEASVVKIKFDDGADWSTVKDTYTVSDSTANALMEKKDYISIGTDGGATFHSCAFHKMMKKVGLAK